jgi:hypothetical protein
MQQQSLYNYLVSNLHLPPNNKIIHFQEQLLLQCNRRFHYQNQGLFLYKQVAAHYSIEISNSQIS